MLLNDSRVVRGRYTLHLVIGKGAFGKVWKAVDGDTGAFVALKQLEPKGQKKAIDQGFIKDVISEINLLSNLNHANIVQYLGCFLEENNLYIVLELIDSGSLQTLIKQYDELGENVIACYTAQILQGLKYLHDQGIIHKDIKAANILMTSSGLCKLTDFGLSQRLQDVDPTAVEGSPYWLAPEVINEEGVSTKSDVWSLGATVIELLTKKPPFYNLTGFAAMYNIATLTEMPLPPNISADCADFLSRCFKVDPRERSSCADLLNHPWIYKHTNLSVENQQSKKQSGATISSQKATLSESSKLLLNNSILPPPKIFDQSAPQKGTNLTSSIKISASLSKSRMAANSINVSKPATTKDLVKPLSMTTVRRSPASTGVQVSKLTHDTLITRLETVQTRRKQGGDLERSESLFGADPLSNIQTDSILTTNSDSDDFAQVPDISDLSDEDKYDSITSKNELPTSSIIASDLTLKSDLIRNAIYSNMAITPKLTKQALKQSLFILEHRIFTSYSVVDAHTLLGLVSMTKKRNKLTRVFRGHIIPHELQPRNASLDLEDTQDENDAEIYPFPCYEFDLEDLQPTETAGILISNIMAKRGFLSILRHIANILCYIQNFSSASPADFYDEVSLNLDNLYNTRPTTTNILKNKLRCLRERQGICLLEQKKDFLKSATVLKERDLKSGVRSLRTSSQLQIPVAHTLDANSETSSTASARESVVTSLDTARSSQHATDLPPSSPSRPPTILKVESYSHAPSVQKMFTAAGHRPHTAVHESSSRNYYPSIQASPNFKYSLFEEALPSKSINMPFLGSSQIVLGREFDDKYYIGTEILDTINKGKKGDPKALSYRRITFWKAAFVLYMYEYCIVLCKILYTLCQYSPKLVMNLTVLGLPVLMKQLLEFQFSGDCKFLEKTASDFFKILKAQVLEAVSLEPRAFRSTGHSSDNYALSLNDNSSVALSSLMTGQMDSGTSVNRTSQPRDNRIMAMDHRLVIHLFLTYTTLNNQNPNDKAVSKSFQNELKASADRILLAIHSFTYHSLPVIGGADQQRIVGEKERERTKNITRKFTKESCDILYSSTIPTRHPSHFHATSYGSQLPARPRFSTNVKPLDASQTLPVRGHKTGSIERDSILVDRQIDQTASLVYGEASCFDMHVDVGSADISVTTVSYPCDKDALLKTLDNELYTVISDLLQVFIDAKFVCSEYTSIDYCLILHTQILQLCNCLLATKDARFVIQVIGIIYKLLYKDASPKSRKISILSPKYLSNEAEMLTIAAELYQIQDHAQIQKALSSKVGKLASDSVTQQAKPMIEIPTISQQSYITILITEGVYEYIAKALNSLLFWKIMPPVLDGSPYRFPTCKVDAVGQNVDWNNVNDLDLSVVTTKNLRQCLPNNVGEATNLEHYLSIFTMNEKRLQALEQGVEVYNKLVELDTACMIFTQDILKTYINFIGCALMSCLPNTGQVPISQSYPPTSLPYRIHSIVHSFLSSLHKFVLVPDFVQTLTTQTIETLVKLLIDIQCYRIDDILEMAVSLFHKVIQFSEIHAIALNKQLIPVCYRLIHGVPFAELMKDVQKSHSQRSSPCISPKDLDTLEPISSAPTVSLPQHVVQLVVEIILKTSTLQPTKRFPNQQKKRQRVVVPFQDLLSKIFSEFCVVDSGKEQRLSYIFDLCATYPTKVLCLLGWFFDCSKYHHVQQAWRRITTLIVCPTNLAKLSVLLSNEKIASEVVGDLARFIKKHESIPQFLSTDKDFLQNLCMNLRNSQQNATKKGCMDIFEHIYLYSCRPRQLIARFGLRELMIHLACERAPLQNSADSQGSVARTAIAMKAQNFLVYIQSFESMY